jgi:aminoacrylate hydrolase
MDQLGIDKAHVAGTSTGGTVLQHLAIDHPDRVRCCIFSNTWIKADEYITRVQTARKQIALAYGPEEYVKVSSLFTNGAMQFRYNLDRVMELERRSLKTVAPKEILAARLDMTMAHDRTADLHKIKNPSLVIGTLDDSTVPSYQSEDLHNAVAGSKLVIVEEGGHYSYRRHWQEWNKIADAFIRENEAKI